ncbi:formate dehydrogenase subunit delta [Bosea sp. LjRoot9]|uniref:formate dehydrogenase subunit delta n=1 Tax=Bosea sp. LjRoot9 TaxID=3342341 RepID=UPI003ED0D721
MSEAVLSTSEARDAHKAEQCEKLARMAGQIADFFKSYPDEQAVPAIADHINQFWSRRMREDFLAAFKGDSQELQPLVRRALALIRPARGG